MEAVDSSEKFVTFYQTTRRRIPEEMNFRDRNLYLSAPQEEVRRWILTSDARDQSWVISCAVHGGPSTTVTKLSPCSFDFRPLIVILRRAITQSRQHVVTPPVLKMGTSYLTRHFVDCTVTTLGSLSFLWIPINNFDQYVKFSIQELKFFTLRKTKCSYLHIISEDPILNGD
jgi:hypothetical protein